jgi:glycosyltransferase involved in cell wall biosynthesis
MKKKICYLAAIDLTRKSGIADKIRATVTALDQAGYEAESHICERRGLAGALMLRRKLGQLDADLIILRSRGPFGILLADRLVYKRLAGTKIVIDIPTPIRNAIMEVWGLRKNFFVGVRDVALLFLAHPWCDLPAHLVIQYAEEHKWFLIGLRKKTVLLGNGVAVSRLPLAITRRWQPPDPLTLIAVSALAFWHGYDRVIQGLSKYNASRQDGADPPVKLLLIGQGPERERLEAMVKRLALTDHVEFLGYRTGPDLHRCYARANIAVSAIGGHRKGLFVASPLKSREALAMGLPIIYSYEDPDLPANLSFAHRVPANDFAIDIPALIEWYAGLWAGGFSPSQARAFSARNLDFSTKIWPYTQLLT